MRKDRGMQQIRRRSLVDTVVEQMRHEITEGRWAVGKKIPSEAELTDALGVSRPSVREGVRSLVQLGLLETRQGDGTYVIADDPTQVALRRALETADSREVIRVRLALDALAAREAAGARTDDDLRMLEQHLKDRERAIQNHDLEAFANADVAFHLGVANATGNRLLRGLYASFDASLKESVTDMPRISSGEDPDRFDDHKHLLEAIAARDPERAEAAALGVLVQQERLLDESE